jgi:hypothetical protein
MAQLPVIYAGKHHVSFLGYAERFTEAYVLAKKECVKHNMIFKKAHTRCLTSSQVHLCFGSRKTEFPCWIHEPQTQKKLKTTPVKVKKGK